MSYISSQKCPYCTGKDGNHKMSYNSREEAERVADNSCSSRYEHELRVYKCPHGHGWHLTKR